jgi:intein/homing endonuclease
MGDIFDLYRQYKYVKILSQDDRSGELVFAPIKYIWESGVKDVYEVKTKYGYQVRTSDEHLFFVNGKYIPLKYMKEGDSVIVSDNYNMECDYIKSIKKLRRKEMMCDLEIAGTANLFASGIKCHNSRWFRMLFKS